MTNVKTYFKNDKRAADEQAKEEPFVSEWQRRGISPQKVDPSLVINQLAVKNMSLPLDNPRAPRGIGAQDTRTTLEMPMFKLPRTSSGALNVGNSFDMRVNSRDESSILDDLSGLNLNTPMIDNNDTVTLSAFEFENGTEEHVKEHSVEEHKRASDMSDIIESLHDNNYLLIVGKNAVCSGTMEEIQEQAYSMFVGNHEICGPERLPINIEDMNVIKKVAIKVGLFLDRE